MKRIKTDRYRVYAKGREYEVLKFPYVKNMWTFNDFPEFDTLMVDGSKEAFMWIKYALAILLNNPNVIIYFPCKKQKIQYGVPIENFDLVLCRPELQFRRSLWKKIKPRLNKMHYDGKYVLQYDRKKLDDYYEKGLWKKFQLEKGSTNPYLYAYDPKGKQKRKVEEILGDTMFLVLDRIRCYQYHYDIAKEMDHYHSGKDCYMNTYIGWIVSDENIRDLYRKKEQEKRDRLKKLEEFGEEIVIPELMD